jgi:hypothetical protein
MIQKYYIFYYVKYVRVFRLSKRYSCDQVSAVLCHWVLLANVMTVTSDKTRSDGARYSSRTILDKL